MSEEAKRSPEFYPSQRWVPPKLEGQDVSNFRYIPGLSEELRARIERLLEDESFTAKITPFLPHQDSGPENPDVVEFLDILAELDDTESRTGSRLFDQMLSEEIGEGVLVMRNAVDEVNVTSFETKQGIQSLAYKSMPTELFFKTIGGFSLSRIRIKDGDPETVEGVHVHNGGRVIIALSKKSVLVLPDREVSLNRGDVIWMPPWMLHSFQAGDFIALHPSEAGFDHSEAFVAQQSSG